MAFRDQLDALIHDAMAGRFDRAEGEAKRYNDLWSRLDAMGLRAQSQRFASALKHGRLPEELDAFSAEFEGGRP